MPERLLTRANPPTRARLLLAAGGQRRDGLKAPAVEEGSTRAERPSRSVDLLTVLSGRAVTPSNASADPTTHEFTGWPPVGSPSAVENLLLLSRLWALSTGLGGPTTDHTSTRHNRLIHFRLQHLHLLLRG